MRRVLAIAGVLAIALAYKAAGLWGVAGACVGVIAVGYAVRRLDLRVRPYGRCWWCKGTGKNWWSTKSRWGRCWFCHGKTKVRRGAQERK